MKNILILFAVILAVSSNSSKICMANKLPEDAILTTPELIKKYGYPVEIHTITTSDGYVLEVHRIPQGRKCSERKKKAVLLYHGLLGSSANWLNPGPKKGLGYILADAGYDVWLTNSRGNRYSRNHTHLHPDKDAKQFWDFSWHEIGIYDLPATIDYMLNQTKTTKIFFVGYSQGTTIYYVMASEKPEYNNKVAVAISLAPIAYLKNMYSPITRKIFSFQWVFKLIAKWIGLYEFMPHSELLNAVTNFFCGDDSEVQVYCSNAMFNAFGYNKKQMNATLIPIVTGHFPAGGSIKEIFHHGQLHKSGKFRQYDYGLIRNVIHYGTVSPPDYKLKDVSTPMYIYYSRNDWMSDDRDVLRLADELGNVLANFLVCDKEFNHVDYLFGIDTHKLVYERIIRLFARF